MARISVLLPVYNVQAYVAEAIASIQAQTISDLDIVIVDDGSTDGTLQIVERIAAGDPRILIVRANRNLGLPSALNLGLSYCRAPFIARMDGDDIALSTRLEKQLRFLEENPGIVLVGCATRAIDRHGNPILGLGISRKPTGDEEVARTALVASPCLHIWLARAELYRTLGGYRELPVAEDYDFLLRALTAGYRITNLAEPLMLIRTRPGNLSSRLEQRKAHYYIAKLYRERRQNGRDSFTPKSYEMAVRCGRLEDGAYRLATRCARSALRGHNRVLRILLLAFSAALSPWQARYFLDRVRFKLALRTAADVS